MQVLEFCRHRLRRLRAKFNDLYATSGSLTRASFYIVKFIVAKLPYLLTHLIDVARSRHLAAELQRRREAAPSHFMLAVKLSGGIGDYLVAARWLRDLAALGEPLRFDIYCNNAGVARWVFANVPEFGNVYSEFVFARASGHYDCGVWLSQFVITYGSPPAAAPRRVRHPRLDAVLDAVDAFRPRIATFVDHHPFRDGDLARFARGLGYTRATFLHGMSGLAYGGDRLALASDPGLLQAFGLASRRFITIHNGFDPHFIITAAAATKCYPHFAEVVALIKAAMPEVVLVQVGTTTSAAISGIDIDLIGQTSLPELAALVGGSVLHIGNESGLAHLASCFGVPSCVVFGPTPADYFGYSGNANLRPPICGDCWWMNETWMDDCPVGYGAPLCMTQQRPQAVAAAALAMLRRQPAVTASARSETAARR